mmetsp:Transcript_2725/g.11110  ORF Transcript_2725/g.11110 Transcript_2725/m.11110 type:complete len:270 (+) Transcript_2725:72-881(+)
MKHDRNTTRMKHAPRVNPVRHDPRLSHPATPVPTPTIIVTHRGSSPVRLTCANTAPRPCFWYAANASRSPSPYTSVGSVLIWFATNPAMAARLCSSQPSPPSASDDDDDDENDAPMFDDDDAPFPPPPERTFLPLPTPIVSIPRAATCSTHSSAMSWHKPSSILGRRRGYPPAMRTYACVHSCAKIAPAHTAGNPYSTTTALTTVAPRDCPTTRSLNPTGKNPPAKSGVLSTVYTVCSSNRHKPRVRAVRPLCQPSLSSASLRVSCDTR